MRVSVINMPHCGHSGRSDKGVAYRAPLTGGSATELSVTDACEKTLGP
jgi:hypothetical protein